MLKTINQKIFFSETNLSPILGLLKKKAQKNVKKTSLHLLKKITSLSNYI